MDSKFQFQVIQNTSQNNSPVEVCQVTHSSGFTMYAFESSLNWDKDGEPQSYGLNNPDAGPDTTQSGIVQQERTLAYAADPWKNCQYHLDNPTADSNQHLFRWAAIKSAQQDPPGYTRDTRPFLESRVRQQRDNDGNLIALGPKEPGFFPVIQKQPSAGYFISVTSETTGLGTDQYDQRNYVNATEISYMAHAGWWKQYDVLLGDFGFGFYHPNQKSSGFAFADTGVGKVGECSTKLFSNLWPGQSPYRVNNNKVTFLVFPASGRTIRRENKYTSDSAVQQQSKRLVQQLNDIDDISGLVLFLSCGASLTAYQQFEDRNLSDDDMFATDMRYRNVTAILKAAGVKHAV